MFGGFFCGFAALGNPLLGFPRPTFHWKLGLPSLRFADAKEFRSLRGAPSRLRPLDTRQKGTAPSAPFAPLEPPHSERRAWQAPS